MAGVAKEFHHPAYSFGSWCDNVWRQESPSSGPERLCRLLPDWRVRNQADTIKVWELADRLPFSRFIAAELIAVAFEAFDLGASPCRRIKLP